MISDTTLTYIVIIILINYFGSKLIPQIMMVVLIIYTIYTNVAISFEPINIIIIAITLLYSLMHIIEASDDKKEKVDD